MSDDGQQVRGLLDHLFRREAGKMVAVLTRSFGTAHLALAEEVVQEAMLQALRRWPYSGLPERPAAWLYRVARNLALDRLRRDASFRGKTAMIRRTLDAAADDAGRGVSLPGEITDDQLRLVFLCCHPELPRDARVALTLKTVCGFSVAEIARAFLDKSATVAQRLVRAQRRIRDLELPFEVPEPAHLAARLSTVVEVLYLLFNEGYGAHRGDDLVRHELCAEALRLTEELSRLPAIDSPEVDALAALLAFQASRLPSRTDGEGNLVRLDEQDRGRWDRRLIAAAFRHLERAARGPIETPLHLQAAIAAQHAAAASAAEVDWPAILRLYDRLLALQPTPIVALNRAVAVGRVEGPRRALEAIERLEEQDEMSSYYLLPATRAELLLQAGDARAAAQSYREALRCPCSGPERRFLERQLEEIPAVARGRE